MRFGCHISTRNGYLGAAQMAKQLGAVAFQYFPKNPRSLKTKRFDERDAERCRDYCKENSIVSIGHSAYPTNLAAEDEKIQWVIDSILNDLEITEACGSIGTVVHFASYHGNPLEGYKKMIETLNIVLSQWNGESLILIENNAGKGGQLGLTLEELVKIRELVDHPEKIGFCFDTCHAFASGLWNGENWGTVEALGEALGYFGHLKAIHLNNSVYETGSKKDRHANIKNGQIPIESMKHLIKSRVIKDLPLILETPDSVAYTHGNEIADLREWMNT